MVAMASGFSLPSSAEVESRETERVHMMESMQCATSQYPTPERQALTATLPEHRGHGMAGRESCRMQMRLQM
jgi:hypothetical protein